MKNKLQHFFLLFRLWLLRKTLSEDEKYLITEAIEERIDNLERVAVKERWADREMIQQDCRDYRKIQEIFSA